MEIRGLGYLALQATDVEAWRRFGTEVVGMAEGDGDGGSLFLRVDERPFRLSISAGEQDGLQATGWEVADAAALEVAVSELEAAGVSVKRAATEEAAERRVGSLVRFSEPSGAELELFCDPQVAATPFRSPIGVSGFVTGDQGFGHLVLLSPCFEESVAFYTKVLGFRESDTIDMDGMHIQFLHCNARHHSLALVAGPRPMLAHFMVEAASMDDVGYAYDRFRDAGVRIKQELGRHTNDHMFSFYAQTPGRFEVEFGWGGRQIDDSTWQTSAYDEGSFWGHRRPPKPAST